MAWPKSFQPESGECKGCAHVRQHVYDCLTEKSGGIKSLQMNDLATDICQWAEKRGMTLVPRHLPGHLNVLVDHLSWRGQIFKTEWSLSQTVRPEEKHEIGNIHLPHSAGDGVESGQSCPELGRPVRLCVPSNKHDKGLSKQGPNRKRREIILIAPGWPNQEWFPDLLDLAIDFQISLPPVQKLLKQTSHHSHPHPWNLNLHACHVKQINPIKATVQQLASFFSSNRKMRISANCWTVALTGLICLTWHHSPNTFHLDS